MLVLVYVTTLGCARAYGSADALQAASRVKLRLKSLTDLGDLRAEKLLITQSH